MLWKLLHGNTHILALIICQSVIHTSVYSSPPDWSSPSASAMRLPSAAFFASTLLAAAANARFVIYADEWHPTRPTNPQDRAGIDHVVLAFAVANATATFQSKGPSVSTIRSEFPNAKVMIAVGGWGDDVGFFQVSQTDASIQAFAADIATMLTNTDADGVGEDYMTLGACSNLEC
jgi:chitinase